GGTCSIVQDVESGTAVESVATRTAGNDVPAATGVDDIDAPVGADDVRTAGAGYGVVSVAGDQVLEVDEDLAEIGRPCGEVDGVGAAPGRGVERVAPGAPVENFVYARGIPGIDDVVAAVAVVVPLAAGVENVVSGVAVDVLLAPLPAPDRVLAGAAVDDVGTRASVDVIVTGPAVDDVVAAMTEQRVVAGAAIDDIGSLHRIGRGDGVARYRHVHHESIVL